MPITVGFKWDGAPPDVVFAELSNRRIATIRRGIKAIADKWAPILTQQMKDRAPWQDITGEARRTLHTDVEQVTEDMVQIVLSHGVSYGVFLELKNGGRFAVIAPMLDEFAPKIWADVVALARG